MPKNEVFGLLKKIESLDLAGNGLKRCVLLLYHFSRKPHVLEKSQKPRKWGFNLKMAQKRGFRTFEEDRVQGFGWKRSRTKRIIVRKLLAKTAYSGMCFYRFYRFCSFRKMSQNGPKWPQNEFFWTLKKIESKDLAENGLKWYLLLLYNFSWKSHIWQKGVKWVKWPKIAQKWGFWTFEENWV